MRPVQFDIGFIFMPSELMRVSIVLYFTFSYISIIRYFIWYGLDHTGQCKSTGGCYNELVVAIFRSGAGVKGKKINLNLLTL